MRYLLLSVGGMYKKICVTTPPQLEHSVSIKHSYLLTFSLFASMCVLKQRLLGLEIHFITNPLPIIMKNVIGIAIRLNCVLADLSNVYDCT